jgi:hypothetical protein
MTFGRAPVRDTDKLLCSSSTCGHTFYIPRATSFEQLREGLLYSIHNCPAIDGDGGGRMADAIVHAFQDEAEWAAEARAQRAEASGSEALCVAATEMLPPALLPLLPPGPAEAQEERAAAVATVFDQAPPRVRRALLTPREGASAAAHVADGGMSALLSASELFGDSDDDSDDAVRR